MGPKELESAEGVYKQQLAATYAEPVLTSRQLAELAPYPCRFTHATVRRPAAAAAAAAAAGGSAGGETEAESDGECDDYVMYNCREIIYLYRNARQPTTLTYGGHTHCVPTAHAFNATTRDHQYLEVNCGSFSF